MAKQIVNTKDITTSDTYIYALMFGKGQLCYIGKSKKPYFRYQQHLKKMTNGYQTKRIQNAYNLFGVPGLHLLYSINDEYDAAEQERNCIAGAGHRSLNSAHASQHEAYYTSKTDYKILIRHLWLKRGLNNAN